MGPLVKISAVAAVLALSSCIASADTIQLGSYATGTSSMGNANTAINYAGYNANSPIASSGTGGTTYALAPPTLWINPVVNSTWVGYAASAGPVVTSNPPLGYYTFNTTFTGSSGLYSGTLSILADDTAEVFLNGQLLVQFGALGTDIHCADAVPNCLTVDTISLSGLSLLSGANANTFTFVVDQVGLGPVGGNGDPTGFDFKAALTSAVPEPSSLLLMATGLLGGAAVIFRRKRKAVPAASTSAN
jgi:hypothetical protein